MEVSPALLLLNFKSERQTKTHEEIKDGVLLIYWQCSHAAYMRIKHHRQ